MTSRLPLDTTTAKSGLIAMRTRSFPHNELWKVPGACILVAGTANSEHREHFHYQSGSSSITATSAFSW